MIESWLVEFIPAEGMVAVDVGANRGEWAQYLANRFDVVHAIEPNPEFWADLRALAGVQLHPVGAWSNDCLRWFTLFDRPEHTSAVGKWDGSRASAPRSLVEWHCMALDDLSIRGPVEFVKIDVEGAEYPVLLGAQGLIQRDRPMLLIEVHGRQSGEEVKHFLDVMGYVWRTVPFPGADDELRDRWFWIVAEAE